MKELSDKLVVNTTINRFQINKIVRTYLARIHDVDYGATSIHWENENIDIDNLMKIENDLNFACTLNINKKSTSEENDIQFTEKFLFTRSNEDMKKEFITMLYEYLNLDDHEYAKSLEDFSISNIIGGESFDVEMILKI